MFHGSCLSWEVSLRGNSCRLLKPKTHPITQPPSWIYYWSVSATSPRCAQTSILVFLVFKVCIRYLAIQGTLNFWSPWETQAELILFQRTTTALLLSQLSYQAWVWERRHGLVHQRPVCIFLQCWPVTWLKQSHYIWTFLFKNWINSFELNLWSGIHSNSAVLVTWVKWLCLKPIYC